jgi:hypothetical protein
MTAAPMVPAATHERIAAPTAAATAATRIEHQGVSPSTPVVVPATAPTAARVEHESRVAPMASAPRVVTPFASRHGCALLSAASPPLCWVNQIGETAAHISALAPSVLSTCHW